jgi:predicted nuclease with TOPRIM domain
MGVCSSKKSNYEITLERELEDIREKWRVQRARQKRIIQKLETIAEENIVNVQELTQQNEQLEEQKDSIDTELTELYAKFERLRDVII